MTNCKNCEFKNSNKTCWCITIANNRLCELAYNENREDYKKLIREKTNHPDNLFSQATSFIKSVANEITEGKEISKEQVEQRLSICRECELFDAERQKCKMCGCNMPFKVNFSTASCPLTPPKWGPIE